MSPDWPSCAWVRQTCTQRHARGEQAPETGEAITRIVLLSRNELWERIDSGALYDPFTVQALGLYEHRLAEQDAH